MTDSDIVLIPHTGQILDLRTATTDELAPIALELAATGRQVATLREQVDRELAARLDSLEVDLLDTPAGYTITRTTGGKRVWDADDLEATARDLVDRGIITPTRYTGLIHHQARVDGNIARRLLGQLTGAARAAVEACYRWEPVRARITVTPPGVPAIEATSEDE